LRMLRLICPDYLLEEIEGDLVQRFHRDIKRMGVKHAKRRFTWHAIRFFRPGILFRNKFSIRLNQSFMVRSYFKTAWRNLTANKFYSIINMTGLTVGLAVGLLILLWVNDELSFDRFNSKADRIYRVNVQLESGGNKFVVGVTQPPLAVHAVNEVPGIQNAARVTEHSDYAVLRYQDVVLKGNMLVYADPSLFRIFDYKLLKGNIDALFPDPYAVVITESAAERFFGNEDPMGRTLIADNKDSFVVTGVLADFPQNSSIKGDIFFSTALVKKQREQKGRRPMDEDWGNYGWFTFLQVEPGVSIKSIEEKLTQINVSHQPHMKPVDAGAYRLQSLTDLHLYAPDGTSSGMQTVKIFSVVAVLILLIASINYVNLSTARALLRSKEVSVRKIIGAARIQLFAQFIIETMLFFSVALILAFGLIALAMPLYNTVAGKQMYFDLLDAGVWKMAGGMLLITLLASSVYPALLLSSFRPVHALKGKLSMGVGSAGFRKILVVCQFAFSVALIIATLVISSQLSYIRQKGLGYDKSFVLSVNMNSMQAHYESARAALLAHTSISDITSATHNIINVAGSTLDVDWDGKDPDGSFFVHTMGIDKDFLNFFKLELAAGSNFTGARTDSAHFILNETAVREAGIKDPVGKRFTFHGIEGTIIGVVKDFHFASLKNRIEPFLFFHQPASRKLFVKTTGKDAAEAVQAVEKMWKQYNEGFVFDYTFMDETYDNQYRADQRTGMLFNVFAAIAILISCLGLFGLATYTAQVKIKEIGIRKVLGASVANITAMLSRDFMILVFVAIIMATPVAGILMQKWLQAFAYRVDIHWWIFALAGAAALLIALVTISFQSIKAAVGSPVKSLKNE
jgi:putative ABC transport system permease protein